MLQHAGSVTGRRELVDLNQIVRDSARIAGEAFKLQRPEFESHLEAVLSPDLAPVHRAGLRRATHASRGTGGAPRGTLRGRSDARAASG